MVTFAAGNDLGANLQPYLGDDTQHVALVLGCLRADDEVGTAQGVEMGGMVGNVEGHVKQLTQLFGSAGRINLI